MLPRVGSPELDRFSKCGRRNPKAHPCIIHHRGKKKYIYIYIYTYTNICVAYYMLYMLNIPYYMRHIKYQRLYIDLEEEP